MRVPDSLMQYNYLKGFNKSKSSLTDLQIKMSSLSKINKPSDDPLGNARVMRLQNRLTDIESYQSNINYVTGFIESSLSTMGLMRNEIIDLEAEFTKLNSPVPGKNLDSFVDSVDATLELLVDLANTDFNGTYIFGGTDSSAKPINYDKANKVVKSGTDSIDAEKKIKISPTITQKFNISGKELFQSVLGIKGNVDLNAAAGDIITQNSKVYNAEGKEFNFSTVFEKTDGHTYNLTYTLEDSDGNTILNKTVDDLVFDEDSGELITVDGDKLTDINITDSTNKIDFVLDLKNLQETDATAALGNELNRKADIFNTLINIRENLKDGKKPTDDQLKIISDFKQDVLDMESYGGGIANKLNSAKVLLNNQKTELLSLISEEKDIDFAKASTDLMTAQYSMEVSYKISSMILPKSILDYL